MATTILEQIAAAIATRLATITTGNGYNWTTAGTKRPTRQGGYTPAEKQVLLIQDEPEIVTENVPVGHEQWIVEFEIQVQHNNTATPGSAAATIHNMYAGDVKKALGTDLTFGGLALGLHSPGPGIALEDRNGKFAGTSVPFPVELRHLLDNPYSQ